MIRDHVRHYKSAPGTQIFHDLSSENREIKRADSGCGHTIAIFMADRYPFRSHIKFTVTDSTYRKVAAEQSGRPVHRLVRSGP